VPSGTQAWGVPPGTKPLPWIESRRRGWSRVRGGGAESVGRAEGPRWGRAGAAPRGPHRRGQAGPELGRAGAARGAVGGSCDKTRVRATSVDSRAGVENKLHS
jgi:hypothetical protein